MSTEIHMVTREEMIREMCDPGRRDREALRELQQRHKKLFDDYVDATMALGLVTGIFPPFNETVRKRAQDLLDKRGAEWKEKGH